MILESRKYSLMYFHCMIRFVISIFISLSVSLGFAQIKENRTREMHYNRIIHSAGKIISYGDSSFENHTLDFSLLPNGKDIAIEDRYGIGILDINTNKIISRFSYDLKGIKLMNTFSGICSVNYKGKLYVMCSASSSSGSSAVVITEWDGEQLINPELLNIASIAPAGTALPNQIIANDEEGVLYIYVVLNGNNQLLKYRFIDKKLVYAVPTGAAPYGLVIVKNKAYVTNWAGAIATDSLKESAGIPWGNVYTDPTTGATINGSLSILNMKDGSLMQEIELGFHPNSITKSFDEKFLYISNSNNDVISVIKTNDNKLIESIPVGIFGTTKKYYNGSSPNALSVTREGKLYVANGIDNAIAVINLGEQIFSKGKGKTRLEGYIPTEAYPGGLLIHNNKLYVANIEATGSHVSRESEGYTIHQQLASISIIPIPTSPELRNYTLAVKKNNFISRMELLKLPARQEVAAVPVPERIGEPSLFKHVIYIIKENKTYDQVLGDIKKGRGDDHLCIYGTNVTPNQHKIASELCLLDNYYASGKSSAEGHQWTDAGMVSDWVEKNVRAWFRSYPHRQADALVYNKAGFIWNNAMDHGKKVVVYGEACTSHYNGVLTWSNIYKKYINNQPIDIINTSTIQRLRPIISRDYPDCDNIKFTDQLRASVFLKDLKKYESNSGDQFPDLIVMSLPNDHTAGTSPGMPTPRSMVADNDLALGKIIEAVTHSKFWDSTVIFVTEDDSQSGWDHISPYRTTGFIISPYTLLNQTNHTDYNQTCMLRTIENILGIPPMNVVDATARPMFDCFQKMKNNYSYKAVKNNIELDEMNTEIKKLNGNALRFAKESLNTMFKDLDDGDEEEMNRILWFAAKGNAPYPVKLSK